MWGVVGGVMARWDWVGASVFVSAAVVAKRAWVGDTDGTILEGDAGRRLKGGPLDRSGNDEDASLFCGVDSDGGVDVRVVGETDRGSGLNN